ncbi:MAG: electron transporter RnfD [Oscillospiraceae bacterium]|nr:electron transporter RnfD [Oscillospiraceae bacterium]
MEIKSNDSRISYGGRIDIQDNGAHFYYASSYAQVRFKGTEISAVINNSTAWGSLSLGYIIDGRMGKLVLPVRNDNCSMIYTVANSLEPDKEHTLLLYKRHAANHSFVLESFSTDGEFLSAPEKPSLKLEFYGDSVSAGEVIEAVDFVGRSDPPSHEAVYDNSYLSYTWQTARSLGADIHNIAQGGIAVLNDTGYFHAPKMIGMEDVYDKMCYFPEGGELTQWDFSRYIPDAVVFALGQNDAHNGITDSNDIDIADPAYREKWKTAYKDILKSIHSHYRKDTKYIFITTLLMHDPEWDKAIDEIVNELKAEGIDAYHMMFKRNGAATPGHPRLPEHTEMAEELSEFIRSIL